jgi:hypothetical protein
MASNLENYLNDATLTDTQKFNGLRSLGFSADSSRMMMQARGTPRLSTVVAGAQRERLYEKYPKPAIHHAIAALVNTAVGNQGWKPSSKIAERLASDLTPEDIQALGSYLGAGAGYRFGGGLGGMAGTELGGTVGGRLQGRTWGSSALSSAPGALAAWGVPKVTDFLASRAIDAAISNKASTKIGAATAKLFKSLFTDDPELRPPRSPKDLADFYGSGYTGGAIDKAGKKIQQFRHIITSQPAFWKIRVPVPVRTPIQGLPLTNWPVKYYNMPLKQAFDYFDAYRGRGFSLSGAPRGAMSAAADRELADDLRKSIVQQLGTVSPKYANRFNDLSHDYATAATLKDVFQDTVAPGTSGNLNHEKLYQNLIKPDTLNHLGRAIGEKNAQDYVSKVAPGRARIERPQGVYLHVPLLGLHTELGAQAAPREFDPLWHQAIGPVSAAAVSNYMENQP